MTTLATPAAPVKSSNLYGRVLDTAAWLNGGNRPVGMIEWANRILSDRNSALDHCDLARSFLNDDSTRCSEMFIPPVATAEPGPSCVLPRTDGTGLSAAEFARVEAARAESTEQVLIARATQPACRNLGVAKISERDARYELARVLADRPVATGPTPTPSDEAWLVADNARREDIARRKLARRDYYRREDARREWDVEPQEVAEFGSCLGHHG